MSCKILYGHQDQRIDCTDTLLMLQKQNIVNVPASDGERRAILGDPFPGVKKDIVVEFDDNERIHYPEGLPMSIPRRLLKRNKELDFNGVISSEQKPVKWNAERLCIVGTRGYIGSALEKHLLDNGYDGYTMCIDSKRDMITEQQRANYNFFIYFAGYSNRPGQSENDDDFYELASTLNETQTIIYASSSAVYEGKFLGEESDVIEADSLSKYANVMLSREKAIQKYRCKSIGLRLGTAIGVSPNQRGQCFTLMMKDAVFTGTINVQDAQVVRPILMLSELFDVIGKLVNNSRRLLRPQHIVYNVASFNATIGTIAASVARKTGAQCVFSSSNPSPKGFGVSTKLIQDVEGITFHSTTDQITENLYQNIQSLYQTWQNPISKSVKCFVCDRDELIELIDLGEQCLANAFHRNDGKQDDTKYPLAIYRCPHCTHSQLGCVIDPTKLFIDYIYVSGTSSTVKEHCSNFANKLCIAQKKIVLDIACNDGTQLNYFKQHGWSTFGVDPARNLAPIAQQNGHKVVVGFWGDESTTEALKKEQDNFDVIVAQNVFAHVPNPRKFLIECKKVMNQNSDLYLQTSQAEIFQTGEFDTIYHEHLSFFSIKSMQYLAQSCGFLLYSVEKVPVHGVSYIFHLKLASEGLTALESVQQLISEEAEIYSFETPIRYKTMAMKQTQQTATCLKNYSQFKIVGYGACAKGNTFLSFLQKCDPQCPMPKYIVDENPLKQGLFTPATNIPVCDVATFSAEQGTLVVFVLAWNFRDEILEKIRKIRGNQTTIVVLSFPQNIVYLLFNGNYHVMSKLSVGKPPAHKKSKTLLITHVYNEEYLMPFFIRHYSTMFDDCVVIDYNSTDRTREVFNALAPSTWKIITSRNRVFSAQIIDDEVREIEKTFPNDVWKYVPTITELLIFPNMDEYLSQTTENALMMPSYDAVGPDAPPVDENKHLLPQRAQVTHPGHPNIYRAMHRNHNNDRVYDTGRHNVVVPKKFIDNAYHIKLRCAPWPEIINRKLQIGQRENQRWLTLEEVEAEKRMLMSRSLGNLYCPSLSSLNAEVIKQSSLMHMHFGTSWCCTE